MCKSFLISKLRVSKIENISNLCFTLHMHIEKEKMSKITDKTELFSKELFDSFSKSRCTVLYGLRRSGKTFFLKNSFAPLCKNVYGCPALFMDLEEISRLGVHSDSDLIDFFNSKLGDFKFVIFDEVSLLENFPFFYRFIKKKEGIHFLFSSSVAIDYLDALKEKKDVDLSFFYFGASRFKDFSEGFERYLRFGFLPSLKDTSNEAKSIFYLERLLDQILLPEIAFQDGLRSPFLLKRILVLLGENLSTLLNSKILSGLYLQKYAHSVDPKTIEKYLLSLEKHFLVQKVTRRELKEGETLGALYKYYFRDEGIRNAARGFENAHLSGSFEELTALLLSSYGFSIENGFFYSFYTNEKGKRARKAQYIDFVLSKEKKQILVQVVERKTPKDKIDKKKEALRRVAYKAAKFMVYEDDVPSTMDEYGIRSSSLVDFLNVLKTL